MNIAKLEKKFGSNEFVSYIEISKPNLRNNLKQLFAMKNLILIFALALATTVNAQSNPFGEPTKFLDIHVSLSNDSLLSGNSSFEVYFQRDDHMSYIPSCKCTNNSVCKLPVNTLSFDAVTIAAKDESGYITHLSTLPRSHIDGLESISVTLD